MGIGIGVLLFTSPKRAAVAGVHKSMYKFATDDNNDYQDKES